MKKVLAGLLVVLALTMAIVPFFTDCESHGRMIELPNGRLLSMKCHWSGIAEIGAAVPVGLAGIFLFTNKRKETGRSMSVMGLAGGALAILFPTLLIGTCMDASMPCNALMKPSLILLGTLAIAASVVLFFQTPKAEVSA